MLSVANIHTQLQFKRQVIPLDGIHGIKAMRNGHSIQHDRAQVITIL